MDTDHEKDLAYVKNVLAAHKIQMSKLFREAKLKECELLGKARAQAWKKKNIK